uniref:Uncharacterized protein n=1 Tax=Panagrolaimus sp. ES5 TaxID=591445 RepID=A0AC34G101_9BILA
MNFIRYRAAFRHRVFLNYGCNKPDCRLHRFLSGCLDLISLPRDIIRIGEGRKLFLAKFAEDINGVGVYTLGDYI